MISLPAIPDAFLSSFDMMWNSACRVCDHILDFQPDLVLVLMHSGWGPVFSAQVIWQKTQSRPFPPVARANIGREKLISFENASSMITTSYFVGEYSTDVEVGKLLTWIASRSDWQDQLRQQVAEVMPGQDAPQRILVVDDVVHESSTFIIAAGLLELVYPQAAVRFLNTWSWYRPMYLEFMLATLCPVADIFPDGHIQSKEAHSSLTSVAIGSESIDEDFLYWQPITVDSPSVKALSDYRPAAEWVEMSQTIYRMIANDIAERAVSYTPGELDPYLFNFGLRNNWRMMRDIWVEHSLTLRQAMQRYGLTRQDAKHILERWLEFGEVTMEGYGRGTRYVIPSHLRRYMEKQEDLPSNPNGIFWLLPDKLAFGETPYYTGREDEVKYACQAARELLDMGVDCWLDIQIIREGTLPRENPHFLEEARAIGRPAVAKFIPLAIEYTDKEEYSYIRRGRPNRKDIRPILDQIDYFLANGHVLYVSTSSDYIYDLRGILAGCYLARHGQAGDAALEALQACQPITVHGWARQPPSRKARRYVRSWPEGD